MQKKEGILVKTFSGDIKGIIYKPHNMKKGSKSKVYVVDDDCNCTGERLIIRNSKIYAIGYVN